MVGGRGAAVVTGGGATGGLITRDRAGADVGGDVEVADDCSACGVVVGESAVCTAAAGVIDGAGAGPTAAARIARLNRRPTDARSIAGGQNHQRFDQGLPAAMPAEALRLRRMPTGPRRTRHSQKDHRFHHGFRWGWGGGEPINAFMTLPRKGLQPLQERPGIARLGYGVTLLC